jgi:hypothetical protein
VRRGGVVREASKRCGMRREACAQNQCQHVYFCTSKQVRLHQYASTFVSSPAQSVCRISVGICTFVPVSKYFCTSKQALLCPRLRRASAEVCLAHPLPSLHTLLLLLLLLHHHHHLLLLLGEALCEAARAPIPRASIKSPLRL